MANALEPQGVTGRIRKPLVSPIFASTGTKPSFDGQLNPAILLNQLIPFQRDDRRRCFHGLLQDSPAVIIGAMLIAMLLGPVMGVALALLESDFRFLSKSLLAAGVGVDEVMAVAFIIGLATRDIAISHEIMARTAPSLLDLIVALVGGAAVAYATVTPWLSVALVGVAIAAALVPPLAASGILLAHGQTRLALGAVLLTFTNMVAIQLASSIVLWVHGYQKSAEIPRNAKVQFLKGHAISDIVAANLSRPPRPGLQCASVNKCAGLRSELICLPRSDVL